MVQCIVLLHGDISEIELAEPELEDWVLTFLWNRRSQKINRKLPP